MAWLDQRGARSLAGTRCMAACDQSGKRAALLAAPMKDGQLRELADAVCANTPFTGRTGWRCISTLTKDIGENDRLRPARMRRKNRGFRVSSISGAALTKNEAICRAVDKGTFTRNRSFAKNKGVDEGPLHSGRPLAKSPRPVFKVAGAGATETSMIKGTAANAVAP
jgi:hypothetical protein